MIKLEVKGIKLEVKGIKLEVTGIERLSHQTCSLTGVFCPMGCRHK